MYEHILRIHAEVFFPVIVLKQQPTFVKIIVYAALVVGLFVCVQMNKFGYKHWQFYDRDNRLPLR